MSMDHWTDLVKAETQRGEERCAVAHLGLAQDGRKVAEHALISARGHLSKGNLSPHVRARIQATLTAAAIAGDEASRLRAMLREPA